MRIQEIFADWRRIVASIQAINHAVICYFITKGTHQGLFLLGVCFFLIREQWLKVGIPCPSRILTEERCRMCLTVTFIVSNCDIPPIYVDFDCTDTYTEFKTCRTLFNRGAHHANFWSWPHIVGRDLAVLSQFTQSLRTGEVFACHCNTFQIEPE